MRLFEGILLWTAIGVYLATFLLFLGGLIFKKEKQFVLAWRGCVAGFSLHSAAILARWVASGHPPVLWSFEHALAGSWFIMGIFLFIGRYFSSMKIGGIVISPFVLLMLGYGIMGKQTGIEPLPPPYQSNWLWVHVGLAWVAYGAFIISAIMSILYLVKDRSVYKDLARLETLDDLIFETILFGFITLTVEIGAGALWAYGLWGRYWAWDPIETWSLISWLVYGVNIHLRATYGWQGKKAAWFAIISLIAILITFGGIGFIGGVHTTLL
ncbi:MAG: cytochrome c biogenesis protein CcsA [Deltaproteobacteria bacterium]|nr:cytochrome c biogenesis protein CcsA [Deltaproteobacteria bacterium]